MVRNLKILGENMHEFCREFRVIRWDCGQIARILLNSL